MGQNQYLIKLENGCKAKHLIRRYMISNLVCGYTIGKLKMRKLLKEHGFEVTLTRYGMIVYGG